VGRDSGWNAQARDADRLSWGTLWRFHRRHVLVGAILAVAAGAISWSLLAWMSPALVSMVLAVPVGGFLASNAAGDALRRWGLLSTPEEREPPRIAVATEAMVEELRRVPPPPADIEALLADRHALARHVAWLDLRTERRRGDADPILAAAWLRLTEGAGLASLDARQTFAVLASSTIMRRIVDKPERRLAL
jgi:membrane glycosyltransferase